MAEKLNWSAESADDDEKDSSVETKKNKTPEKVEPHKGGSTQEKQPIIAKGFFELLNKNAAKEAAEAEKVETEEVSPDAIETTVETPEEFGETLQDQYKENVAEDLAVGSPVEPGEIVFPVEENPEVIELALNKKAENQAEPIDESSEEKEPAEEAVETLPEPIEAMPEPEEEAPYIPTTSATGQGRVVPPPPVPPVPPPPVGGGGVPPFGQQPEAPTYSSSAPENTVSSAKMREIAKDAAWDERQQGRREGVLAGMLLGGGIEHYRHKRREKKVEKRHKKELSRQEKRAEELENQYARAEQARRVETRAHEKVATEQIRTEAAAERDRVALTAEQEKLEALEKQQKVSEQLLQQNHETEEQEQLYIPKGHHVERSAWHNIEVDKQGRAVENGSFEYGHEYYQERAHESAPKQGLDEAAGEVALVAAALSSSDQQQAGGSTLPQQPTAPQQASKKAKKSLLRTIARPPETPIATLIWLAVLVVLALILLVVMR